MFGRISVVEPNPTYHVSRRELAIIPLGDEGGEGARRTTESDQADDTVSYPVSNLATHAVGHSVALSAIKALLSTGTRSGLYPGAAEGAVNSERFL